jgi:hypothetical protein
MYSEEIHDLYIRSDSKEAKHTWMQLGIVGLRRL